MLAQAVEPTEDPAEADRDTQAFQDQLLERAPKKLNAQRHKWPPDVELVMGSPFRGSDHRWALAFSLMANARALCLLSLREQLLQNVGQDAAALVVVHFDGRIDA